MALPFDARAIGFSMAFEKIAKAIDAVGDLVLNNLRQTSGDETVDMDSVLDDILPENLVLEGYLTEVEMALGINFLDSELTYLMAEGTAGELANMASDHIMAKSAPAEKTANQQRQKSHSRYLAKRPMILAQARVYRMAHMQQLRKKSRSYRNKVKKKIIRPRKRVGTASSGYSFIPR